VTSLSCPVPTAANGFTLIKQDLLGPGGEQVTEVGAAGASAPQHTNVWPGGGLAATYDFKNGGLHFDLADPLGTKRVQVSGIGTAELNCVSLPFGNNIGNTRTTNCTGSVPDATENHFTGKERDSESGLDYFGARYYGSSMGRFMSPDWSVQAQPVPYAKLDNPQSLNLYAYVENNPVTSRDMDGHGAYCAACAAIQARMIEGQSASDAMHAVNDPERQKAAAKQQGSAGTPASARQGTPKTFSKPTWVKSGDCPNGCWFEGQIIPYTLVNSAGKPVKVTGNIAENIEIIASANSDDRTGGGHMQNQSGFVDNVGLVLGYNRIAGPDNPGYSYLKTSQTFTFTPDGGGPILLTTKITQMIISHSNGSIGVGTQVEVP
jgi:RHS repeat-associated protein